jgi:hypothetical protein
VKAFERPPQNLQIKTVATRRALRIDLNAGSLPLRDFVDCGKRRESTLAVADTRHRQAVLVLLAGTSEMRALLRKRTDHAHKGCFHRAANGCSTRTRLRAQPALDARPFGGSSADPPGDNRNFSSVLLVASVVYSMSANWHGP